MRKNVAADNPIFRSMNWMLKIGISSSQLMI